MATDVDTSDSGEPEYKPYTTSVEGVVTALVDAPSLEQATEQFWEGANHSEEFEVGLVGGLVVTVRIGRDSLTATAEGDQYAVEADVDVVATIQAADNEEAIEQFRDGINYRYVTDFALVNGLDVTLAMDTDTFTATPEE